MISIIICSRNKNITKNLDQNISDTIGCEYELITIYNSKGDNSIFSAYNEGIIRAKYRLLCFMHDDILFHTDNWGKVVIKHFQNQKLGIIGVAGSHYCPCLPSARWWCPGSVNVIHTIKGQSHHFYNKYSDIKQNSLEAIILDGLWLCVSREMMDKTKFDDTTFSGFHGYDSDICLQAIKLNYEVRIVFDILIEHFSEGTLNNKWLENVFCLFTKWKSVLPLKSTDLKYSEIIQTNFNNASGIIRQIKINKFGLSYIIKTLYYYLLCNPPITKKNILLLMKLLYEIVVLNPLYLISNRQINK